MSSSHGDLLAHAPTYLPTYLPTNQIYNSLVVDSNLRSRFAEKARSSIVTLEHERVMNMMLENYDNVIHEQAERSKRRRQQQGGNERKEGADFYITFVYYFFKFLLFLGIPIMKTYVAIVSSLCQVIRCSFNLTSAIGCCCCCSSSSSSSSSNHNNQSDGCCRRSFMCWPTAAAGASSRERMRVLAFLLYVLAVVIMYNTYSSITLTTA